MLTLQQIEAALKIALAKVRASVVESWAGAADAEKREQLWSEYQAIDRIEETLKHELTSIIEHGPGRTDPSGSDGPGS